MKNLLKLLIALLTFSNLSIFSQVTSSSPINDRVKWVADNELIWNKISSKEWSVTAPNSNMPFLFYDEIKNEDRGIMLQDKDGQGTLVYLEKDKVQLKYLDKDWEFISYGSWVEGSNYSEMEEDEINSNNEMEEDEELFIDEDEINNEKVTNQKENILLQNDFDPSKVMWNYVKNTSQKCKGCQNVVQCSKKTKDVLASETNLNSFLVLLSAKLKYVLGKALGIPNPYLLDVDLYECPEFCSNECKYYYNLNKERGY
jgi:hypothetical protein